MRVVLDTNVLISGVFWRGRPGVVLEYWVEGRFVLCASQGIMEEYFEVLDRVGARMDRRDLSDRWKAYLFEHIEVVESPASDEFCRDPDDVPFLDCAICVGADYIVSAKKDTQWHDPIKIPNDQIFAILTLLEYMLKVIAPQSKWKDRLQNLFNNYNDIPLAQMGIPSNWKDCPIWQ